MKVRDDVAALIRQGLSNRAIAQRLHVDATRTVAPARALLGLPKVPRLGPKAAESLEAAFRSRTEPADGGHLLWTGSSANGVPYRLSYLGQGYSPRAVAFQIRTGREPEGYVRPECGYDWCVEPTHVDDAPGRERTHSTLTAIFGEGWGVEAANNAERRAA
ncbi:hypothetical protein [Streptomyces sp. ME19-01-6]|uniref:hypothetical protein n=1 Tax=Streptomyces sp. ME19-01-6 TaxID=3028686 RepID=UPI0029ACE92E|nr:hypothetical protein [Streptomyces sp. ME19-01-6]MDX3232920.1 hypothetical protein [Streptomyces sp. ME19-01-6]